MDLVKRAIVSRIAMAILVLSIRISNADGSSYCGTAQWQSQIASAAMRFDLPERWLDAVIHAESGGCIAMNGASTVSSAGAMGLMQLMPNTWAAYREKLQLGDNPHDPHDNILVGSAYLRDLYDRYGWPGALAAYHAGPTRYDEHLSADRPLPQVTLDYLAFVDRLTADETALASVDRTLFVVRPSPLRQSDGPADDTPRDALFIALRHGNRHNQPVEQAPTDVQK
jgi:soluble lytic murein transglycosylase-like protein